MNYLDREMLHGNAETLVLAVLADGESHGYQIRQELGKRSRQYFQISFGRLYPLLRKLESRRLVTARWVKAGRARRRRQYTIARNGLAELRTRRQKWRQFCAAMGRVLSPR